MLQSKSMMRQEAGVKILGQRHGKSKPNRENRISCGSESRTGDGLLPEGREGIHERTAPVIESGLLVPGAKIVIWVSPQLRAQESADELQDIIGGKIVTVEELRERDFATLNGLSANENYEKVWKLDAVDPYHEEFGVESAVSVANRMGVARAKAEKLPSGVIVVFSSHGDPLQIHQADLLGDVRRHRSLPLWQNGEIREFVTA
jgi:broad specificity phosphatase PhoE